MIKTQTFSNMSGKPDFRYIVSQTREPVVNDVTLKVRTSKTNGRIYTRATGVILKDGFESHRVFRDFSTLVWVSEKNATAKNLMEQHDLAMATHFDSIVTEFKAHYLAGTNNLAD